MGGLGARSPDSLFSGFTDRVSILGGTQKEGKRKQVAGRK
jgi:hypothetical protein